MSMYKQVWYFSGNGDQWTEVWYDTTSLATGSAVISQPVIDARLAMLATCYRFDKIRVSDVANPRATDIKDVGLNGTRVFTGNTLMSAEDALWYWIKSNPLGATRRYGIRGLISADVLRGTTLQKGAPSGAFAGFVNTLMTALAAASYRIYARFTARELNITPPRVNVVDGATFPGSSVLTLSAPLTFVAGDRIRIKRAPKKDLPGLNASFSVTPATTTTPTIQYATPGNRLINPTTGVAVIERFHDDRAVSSANPRFLFYGTRQTKNASTGSRGSRFAHRDRSQA